ncbi:HET domain protein [Alternaria alternata]|nr:HET domain protein [Alternaria alternata]
MTSYTYSDLRENEIRLLRLLPSNGNFADDICIVLDHAPLFSRDMQSQWQARLRSRIKLREQLPDGWRVNTSFSQATVCNTNTQMQLSMQDFMKSPSEIPETTRSLTTGRFRTFGVHQMT